MKVKRILTVLLISLIFLSSAFTLSGCGDDEDEPETAPTYTSVSLQTYNYEKYIGIKVTSLTFTPGLTDWSYNASYSVETYSMNTKYEFVNVTVTISGRELTLTNEGFSSYTASMPNVFSYWTPAPTLQKISGSVRIPK